MAHPYLLWSVAVLVPVFGLSTWLLFRPARLQGIGDVRPEHFLEGGVVAAALSEALPKTDGLAPLWPARANSRP